MFHFPGCAPCVKHKVIRVFLIGFPHSEISGSKVARHLTEAYRSHATSFVATLSLGIHHMLLKFLLGILKTARLAHFRGCKTLRRAVTKSRLRRNFYSMSIDILARELLYLLKLSMITYSLCTEKAASKRRQTPTNYRAPHAIFCCLLICINTLVQVYRREHLCQSQKNTKPRL
jgi:hypothetical protein